MLQAFQNILKAREIKRGSIFWKTSSM